MGFDPKCSCRVLDRGGQPSRTTQEDRSVLQVSVRINLLIWINLQNDCRLIHEYGSTFCVHIQCKNVNCVFTQHTPTVVASCTPKCGMTLEEDTFYPIFDSEEVGNSYP